MVNKLRNVISLKKLVNFVPKPNELVCCVMGFGVQGARNKHYTIKNKYEEIIEMSSRLLDPLGMYFC